MSRWSAPRLISLAIGLSLFALGAWAFADPFSFYTQIATYPPYNQHLFHDIGAFQMGLGATLFATFIWTDAPLVALSGVGFGSVMHAVAHIIDRESGGRPTDPLGISLVAVVVLAAWFWRRAQLRRSR